MKDLLTIYLKLETKLNMEHMLKDQIYITYYKNISVFKSELFILDDNELTYFLDVYQINKDKLTQDFIMLYDKKLDSYTIWTEEDSLEIILNYFSNDKIYKHFII